MKSSTRRYLAFVIMLVMLLSTGMTSFAEVLLDDNGTQDTTDLTIIEETIEEETEEVEEVEEEFSLLVKHIFLIDGEENIEEEVVEGIKLGEIVNPSEFILDRDGFQFIESDLTELVISDTVLNEITLFYEQIEKIENYYDIVDSKAMMMSRFTPFNGEPDANEPGAVFISKTAAWVNEDLGIGKVTLSAWGNPVLKGSDVVLVLDRSGSMQGDRLTNTKAAARAFLAKLYEANGDTLSDNRISLVYFNNSATVRPSDNRFLGVSDTVGGDSAYTFLYNAIGGISADGNTNYDVALNTARTLINGRTDKSRPGVIVFMSDGAPNRPSSNRQWPTIATNIKGDGTTIFALGLGLTNSAFTNNIRPIASDPKSTYAKNMSDDDDLTAIFEKLAAEIKIAGTGAVVTDYVNTDNFTVTNKPGTSSPYEPSDEDVVIDSDGKVTWNLGSITQSPKSLTIYIRLNDNITEEGLYDTNFSANMEYKDYEENDANKVFDKPNLPVGNIGSIKMEYYLVNAAGVPIAFNQNQVNFDQRISLGSAFFMHEGSSSLPLNTLFNVSAPSPIVYNGQTYIYNPLSSSNGGSTSPQDITLLPNNKSRVLDFGYMLQSTFTVRYQPGDHGDFTEQVFEDIVSGTPTPSFDGTPTGNEGYYFTGWSPTPSPTVTEDATYVAQWAAKTALIVTANSGTEVYNGELQTVSGYTIGEGLGATHTLGGISASGSGTNVGSYSVNFTGTPVIMEGTVDVTERYDITLVAGNLSITPKEVIVTADNKTKVFGAVDPTLTATISGLVEGEAETLITYSLSRAAGETIGNYAITPTGAALQGNYSVSYVPGNLEITAYTGAIKITAKDGTWEYDGDPHSKNEFEVTGLPEGYTVVPVITGSITNVGTEVNEVESYKIFKGTEDVTGQFSNVTTGNGTLKVTPKEVIVKADNKTKVFGAVDPTLTATISGLVEGEAETLITYSLSRAAGETIGNYAITPTGAALQGNYSVSYVPGNLEITAYTGAIKITAKDGTWEYDGDPHSKNEFEVTGLPEGYTVVPVITGSITNVGTEVNEVESYKIFKGTEDVTGQFSNVTTGNGTLKVTPKEVIVKADNKTKVFGAVDPTLTATISGLVEGEAETLITDSLSRAAGETIGNYAITPTGAALQGNYSVSYVPGNLEITAYTGAIKITAKDGTWEYDGDPHSKNEFEVTGLPEGYTVVPVITGSITNVGTEVNEVESYKIFKGTEDVTGQFSNVTTGNGTLKVTPKDVTIVVDDSSKVFGTPDPAFTGTVSGLVAEGDLGTVTYARTNLDEAVGSYSQVLNATFTPNDNYTVTVTKGDFRILNASFSTIKTGSYVDFNQDEKVNVGDKIDYTITVENTGEVDLTNVVITDPMLELDVTLTILEIGKTWTYNGSYEISQEDIDAGLVTNTVTVVTDQTPEPEDEEEDTDLEQSPELTVEKTANKEIFEEVGEIITYTYTISNTGNVTLSAPFSIEDDKIGEIDISSAPATLAPEDSFTLTAEYEVTQADMDAGFVTNLVVVTGTFGEEEVPGEDEETVEGDRNPDLTITKTASRSTYTSVGQEITYTITVKNTGNVTLTGVTVNDPMIELLGPEGDSNENGKLDVGETWTYKGVYSVTREDINARSIKNTATAETEETEPETSSVTVNYSTPSTPPPSPPPEDEEEIIDEEVPEALPELNKEDHFAYIQGYPDNTVRPEGLITREEVATVFYRLLTESYRDSIWTMEHNFTDVGANRWSTKHIATLAAGGIITGYPDGNFKPGQFITRAELATIASRFDNLSPFESDDFSDIMGHWANRFINSASKKGWVQGYPDGSFKPDQYITRAEFVTLVNNVLERRVHKEHILEDARQFPDLLESKWYYEAMQESINSHHYLRLEDGFEEWTEIYYPELDM